MVYKDIQNLSNGELSLYEINLKNEYQSIQNKIKNLCDDLDKMDKEYNSIQAEKSRRKKMYIKK